MEISMTALTPVQEKLFAIANAHTDYAKAAFESNKAYFEKFATLKSPNDAMQLTSDHMKSGYDAFVAESKKIGEMYKDFVSSAFTPKPN
jgi:hypothetical protein